MASDRYDPPAPSPRGRVAISANALYVTLAWAVSGIALVVLAEPPRVLTFVFVILGWVVTLILHEFSHAYVAWRAGDHTVADKGYLTLDPLKYTDGFTSFVLPVAVLALGGIGMPGGAVWLRDDLMRSRTWRAAASLAGPGANLAALVVLGVLSQTASPGSALAAALSFLALLQATAFVLNILPIPGLDGYGAVRPFLPAGVAQALRPIEPFAIMGVVLAFFFIPIVGAVLFGLSFALTDLVGVDRGLIVEGLRDFQFWKR